MFIWETERTRESSHLLTHCSNVHKDPNGTGWKPEPETKSRLPSWVTRTQPLMVPRGVLEQEPGVGSRWSGMDPRHCSSACRCLNQNAYPDKSFRCEQMFLANSFQSRWCILNQYVFYILITWLGLPSVVLFPIKCPLFAMNLFLDNPLLFSNNFIIDNNLAS